MPPPAHTSHSHAVGLAGASSKIPAPSRCTCVSTNRADCMRRYSGVLVSFELRGRACLGACGLIQCAVPSTPKHSNCGLAVRQQEIMRLQSCLRIAYGVTLPAARRKPAPTRTSQHSCLPIAAANGTSKAWLAAYLQNHFHPCRPTRATETFAIPSLAVPL